MPAKASGISLTSKDIPILLGMAARDDRNHDIAAWFGVNQGRIKEAKDGKFGMPAPAAIKSLPPKGPPGLKGRRLREEVDDVIILLSKGDASGAMRALKGAVKQYDADEL